MKIIAIAAVVEGTWAIGYKSDLIVHDSEDMAHFRTTTKGHTVIMGRKTWESLGVSSLPKRINIVMTSSEHNNDPDGGLYFVKSVDESIELAEKLGTEKAFVIGGGEIYRAFMPHYTDAILTRFSTHHDAPYDTTLPPIHYGLDLVSTQPLSCGIIQHWTKLR
jgi:dihydrofolate reductase